jgi:hypothetical protein
MTAALKYLSDKTDAFFETRMQRAAQRITERGRLFPHRTV